jgi:hypothetical protein
VRLNSLKALSVVLMQYGNTLPPVTRVRGYLLQIKDEHLSVTITIFQSVSRHAVNRKGAVVIAVARAAAPWIERNIIALKIRRRRHVKAGVASFALKTTPVPEGCMQIWQVPAAGGRRQAMRPLA